jgi:hypothetical protein
MSCISIWDITRVFLNIYSKIPFQSLLYYSLFSSKSIVTFLGICYGSMVLLSKVCLRFSRDTEPTEDVDTRAIYCKELAHMTPAVGELETQDIQWCSSTKSLKDWEAGEKMLRSSSSLSPKVAQRWSGSGQAQRLKLEILATREADIGRIKVPGQSREKKKVPETPSHLNQ